MVAVLALLLVVGQTVQRPPRSAGLEDANAKGTAVISGRITAADTGRPLRRAQIRLAGVDAAEARSTSTNARGEYEIRGVVAGRYSLNVTRSGYLAMSHGQRQYGELSKPIQVDDGRTLEKIDFALPRAGVLSGRVTDETGEPVSGVTVWVMRTEYFRGRRRAVSMSPGAVTDDMGQYRASGIPPGEYTVMAVLRDTWVAGPEKHTYSYAPSYHPGTASYAEAMRVKVSASQEASGIDIHLVAARAATLSGTAFKADGTPLAGASVSLTREVAGPTFSSSFALSNTTVSGDGTWTMKGVAPGEYQLEASSRDRIPERASMPIVVQGTEVAGLTLVSDAGSILAGQVLTDDGQPLPPGRSPLRVTAEGVGADRRPMLFMTGDDNGLVKPDGSFSLTGVVGPALVRVLMAPAGWKIKQIEVGGEDYAQKPLQTRSGGRITGVRIVMSNKFPTVTGRITDDEGKPAEGSVVLMPEDESSWVDSGLLYRTRPDQNGLYRIDAVRPGEYLAVALDFVESWQLQDPEYLATLRDRATRVTLREAQPHQVNLKIAR